MKTGKPTGGHSGPRRRGAAHVLIAAMLFVFLVGAAWLVDVAYMQLIRTELRTASDAAAKAGAEALSRLQDANAAKDAAVYYANLNKVGGQPYQINHSDVTLGRVTGQTNGTWVFAANATPYNSVRVNAKIGNGGATSPIPLFFGSAIGHGDFSTSQQSTAGQQEVEVCLCLDRSGSMSWSMNGSQSFSTPYPSASRWGTLATAVNVFLNEAGQFPYPPRTSVVTWSNTFSTDVSLPASAGFSWTTNRNAVTAAVNYRTNNGVSGTTWLSNGLDRAVQSLSGTNHKPLSSRVVILLTDGEWNGGRDPVLAAQDAAAADIVVHTVSMATTAQPVLGQVASITGGRYYATYTSAELSQAFRDIARSLPIVLVD